MYNMVLLLLFQLSIFTDLCISLSENHVSHIFHIINYKFRHSWITHPSPGLRQSQQYIHCTPMNACLTTPVVAHTVFKANNRTVSRHCKNGGSELFKTPFMLRREPVHTLLGNAIHFERNRRAQLFF